MNIFIILAAFVGVAFASPPSEREVHQKWQHFKTTYRKAYENDAEENHRMNIFKENLIKIADHNTRFEKGEVTYRVGVNKHADLRSHEMQAKLSSYRMELKKTSDMVHVSSIEALSSTSSVDWRNEGYVTAVKDQGSCNACWAFSATGALEAQLFKKTSKLVSLSEQNLIDCSSRYGNVGCVGGLMDYAFKYIQDYGGIETEATYPYVSDVTLSIGVCKFNASNSAGTVTGYVDVNPTEKDLEDAVSRIGPVSVGIDSNHWTFKLYSGGIYYEENCSSYTLDHAVLVVGYDTDENGQEYWIVKNSYGEDWGEKGYAKMARNRGNNCGIASLASYPTV